MDRCHEQSALAELLGFGFSPRVVEAEALEKPG